MYLLSRVHWVIYTYTHICGSNGRGLEAMVEREVKVVRMEKRMRME